MSLVAKDVMETRVVAVPPEMPLDRLEEFLLIQGIDGAPVQNEQGEVVGIVSKTDLIRALHLLHEGYLSPERTLTVADIMTREVVFVSPNATIAEVAETMVEHLIHRVLVGSAHQVKGIITAFDLLQLLR